MPATQILGIHLSGAALAGSLTTIARGELRNQRPVVTEVLTAADLPGGGVERELAYGPLRRFLTKRKSAVVAFDSPLGLAKQLVPDADWRSFVLAFADRYPSVEQFMALCAKKAKGRALVRATDRQLNRRMEPHKRREAFKTWHGLAEVLAPLVADDAIRVVPMQKPAKGRPTVLETDAKSALTRRRVAPWFKGVGAVAAESRERVLDELARTDDLSFADDSLRQMVVEDETAAQLEAVVAMVVAAAFATRTAKEPPSDGPHALEGHVYY